MAMVRMDVGAVVVGGGPVPSMVVLRRRGSSEGETAPELPIRIGRAEAAVIGMASGGAPGGRPMTMDLFSTAIDALGGRVASVAVVKVDGTTFHASVNLVDAEGSSHAIDARPSDAVALAVRTKAPIYADQSVLDVAALPALDEVEREEAAAELEEFRAFVAGLSPDDFAGPEA